MTTDDTRPPLTLDPHAEDGQAHDDPYGYSTAGPDERAAWAADDDRDDAEAEQDAYFADYDPELHR